MKPNRLEELKHLIIDACDHLTVEDFACGVLNIRKRLDLLVAVGMFSMIFKPRVREGHGNTGKCAPVIHSLTTPVI